MNKTLGVLSAIVIIFIWSGWIIISKYGLMNQLTSWDITGIRFTTAAIIVTPFLIFNKQVIKQLFNLRVFICSIACGNLYLISTFLGLEFSQASNVGILINGSMPVISAIILFVWNGDKIHFSKYFGILFILLSSLIILIDMSKTELSPSIIWFFISAFFLSFYSVSMKKWNISIKTLMFSVPILNFIVFLPIWLIAPSNLVNAPLNEIILQAGYQGIVVNIIALFFMSYSIYNLGATGAATIMALVPVSVVFLSIYFLNEVISNMVWVSAGFCTFGIVIYNIASLFIGKNKSNL